jgi:hypothetical protein
MKSCIVAGPLGFYALVAPETLSPGPELWARVSDYIGPLRETKVEAEQDLALMLAATVTEEPTRRPITFEMPSPFLKMSDTHVKALYRVAKQKRKGVRPFFRDPNMMIALRNEMESRA